MTRYIGSIYRLLSLMALVFVLTSVAGCATITIESIRDTGYTGKISRLFVLIRVDSQINPQYAQNLQAAWVQRMSEFSLDSRVRIISPLELDESIYGKEIKEFSPDGVLMIQTKGGTRRRHESGMIDLYWDASLFKVDSKNRIWRANVYTPGGYGMPKMLNMTDSILAKLDQDKILTLPAAPVKKQD